MEKIFTLVLDVLQGKSECQAIRDDGQADLEEEEGAGEEELVEAALEIMPAMAQVMGAAFQPGFKAMLPHLMALTVRNCCLKVSMVLILCSATLQGAKRSNEFHEVAIGCLAETVKFMGPPVLPFVEVGLWIQCSPSNFSRLRVQ